MLYIENFQFPNEERRVYPYNLLSQKGLEHIEFAPITILYGNNGSGKSTILNMIAERLAIRDMTLGNTNEYFSSCVRKCTYTLGEKGIPDEVYHCIPLSIHAIYGRSKDIRPGP